MAQQTINVGTSPNDGTGTPLRTAFQYTNSNFSELYTAVGPSGNNIVVPGTATITGDLTVDTSTLKVDSANNRVGIGLTSPLYPLHVLMPSSGTGVGLRYTGGTNNPGLFLSVNESTTDCKIAAGGSTSQNLVLESSGYECFRYSSSGVFTWSNAGLVAGTAMTLNSTGLGVGGSPAAGVKLHVGGGNTHIRNAAGGQTKLIFGPSVNSIEMGGIIYDDTDGSVAFGTIQNYATRFITNNTERVRIDTSGNVGVGVTPSAWNSAYKALQVGLGASIYGSTSGPQVVWIGANVFKNSSNQDAYIGSNFATQYVQFNGTHYWQTAASGTAGNAITFTQAMTLDASSQLFIGTTASGGQNGFCVLRPLSNAVVATTAEIAHNFGALTGTTYATFLYATTAIGSITQNGTTGVLYNINSDYRLKESVAPLSGGLARVNALKPSIYKWKSDGSAGEGFLAHELAEVVPFAVTGEKDAVNEDGSIKSQGIDMSRIVPILVAAIKELSAEVNALKNA